MPIFDTTPSIAEQVSRLATQSGFRFNGGSNPYMITPPYVVQVDRITHL